MNSPKDLSFFDCNATVGRAASPVLGNSLTPEELLAEMDAFGIDEALVTHVYAQELEAQEGTVRTVEAASVSDRLYPIATMSPPTRAIDADKINDGLGALLHRGCRAVRLHPNPTFHIMDEAIYARQFVVADETVGALCVALQNRELPLFIELAQTTWPEIWWLCSTFPNLPVVVLNVTYPHKRNLLAGLQRYANLHFDTSCFQAYRALEEVCDLVGAEQVLFGTRLALYNAASAIGLVMYASIDDEARALIAGNNLRRLLGL